MTNKTITIPLDQLNHLEDMIRRQYQRVDRVLRGLPIEDGHPFDGKKDAVSLLRELMRRTEDGFAILRKMESEE
jgi:hypothetical protein